jgi:hypothetical protein
MPMNVEIDFRILFIWLHYMELRKNSLHVYPLCAVLFSDSRQLGIKEAFGL